MDFSRKNIWITGASSGIGASIAEQLAGGYVQLILSARNREKLQKVAELCEKKGASVEIAVLNMTNTEQISTVSKQVLDKYENIDILIHCAGVSQRSYAMDTIMPVCREFMELNYFSVVDLTQRVLRNMQSRKSGHIVVISSVAGKLGTPMRSSYSASKHALHGYFDSLRAELSMFGIKVTIVCPGYIQTNITLNSLTGDGSRYNKIDKALENGVPVKECAMRIIKGINNNEEEFIVSGLKERLGVLIKRFYPGLFSNIVRKVDTLK